MHLPQPYPAYQSSTAKSKSRPYRSGIACNPQRQQLLYRHAHNQNLPCASEEYNDADNNYVSTSGLVSGSGSDAETEPESLPIDIKGFSDIDSIAQTHTDQ